MDDHLTLGTEEKLMRETQNGFEGTLWKDFRKGWASILLLFPNEDVAQGVPRRPLSWAYSIPITESHFSCDGAEIISAICVQITSLIVGIMKAQVPVD